MLLTFLLCFGLSILQSSLAKRRFSFSENGRKYTQFIPSHMSHTGNSILRKLCNTRDSIPFPVQNGKIIISINIKKAAKRQYGGPVVMVVDNALCHSNIEEVFSEEEFLGCKVLRLGPYSPMFNPIEQVWSLIKVYIKQELAAKIVSILAMQRRDGLSITEQRARALTSLIEKELVRVTPEVCNRFIAGIQSKIPAAVALEDVVF